MQIDGLTGCVVWGLRALIDFCVCLLFEREVLLRSLIRASREVVCLVARESHTGIG